MCCGIFFGCGASGYESDTSTETIVNSSSEIKKTVQQLSNYNFETPSETFIMDKKLGEISSLAYDAEENVLLTNNDENGNIFILDPQSFKITAEEKFAKKGDYESIEKIGDDVIVSKNTGCLLYTSPSPRDRG